MRNSHYVRFRPTIRLWRLEATGHKATRSREEEFPFIDDLRNETRAAAARQWQGRYIEFGTAPFSVGYDQACEEHRPDSCTTGSSISTLAGEDGALRADVLSR